MPTEKRPRGSFPFPYPPRSWVQVHAIVDPPPADPNQPLRVRFMPYDVDDPSSDQPPVDDEWMVTVGPRREDAEQGV